MTHSGLCLLGCRWLKNNGWKVAFHDKFVAAVMSGEIPDVLAFRNGASCLLEVKCSRADFFADRKKPFRLDPSRGMGDWRFFLTPPGLVSIAELPQGWGLLEANNNRIKKVHGWPGNGMWCNIHAKPFVANKQAECDYMYSALRRMEIRGHLDDVYAGIPKEVL